MLIEKFLTVTETTVGILGFEDDLEVLSAVEIIPKSGIYNLESKYTSETTEYITPARLLKEMYV